MDMQEIEVRYLLGRKFYMNLCEHKGFEPRPHPYIDTAMNEYANIAVTMLGYDDEAITRLKAGEYND
tara:strand:+ start:759 stop:959 length:201 start_codon:yes stop_codon:yes gene_type:complete